MFGVPETVHSDNGSQFISKDFAEMCGNYGIHQVFNGSYAPQSNASERVNRSILAAIRSYIVDNQITWDENICHINQSVRSSVHSSIGISPYFALFGRNMISHGSAYNILRNLENLNDGEIEIVNSPDHVKLINDSVLKNLEKSYKKSERTYNLRGCRNVRFEPGQEVYRKNFQHSDFSRQFNAKLSPKYVKARVESNVGNCLYRLTDLNGKFIGVFHGKDIKQ